MAGISLLRLADQKASFANLSVLEQSRLAVSSFEILNSRAFRRQNLRASAPKCTDPDPLIKKMTDSSDGPSSKRPSHR